MTKSSRCTRRQGLQRLWGAAAAGVLGHLPALSAAQTQGASPASPERPLRVVASFSILGDMVAQVAGPVAEVSVLVGPGSDVHVYQPVPADIRRLAQADLLVVNGLNFEGWMQRLVSAAAFKGPVLVCSEGITPRRLGRDADPHAWQDLAHAQHYVKRIRDALIQARPAQTQALQRRAADYTAQLAALDQETKTALAAIPAERRRILTSHDAFGYFGAAYGVEFLAAQGWNTDSEPSAADVARLIRRVKQTGVSAVFMENMTDPRLLQRMAQEAGVVVGGTLYSDSLSQSGTRADSYVKLFRHNVHTLLEGLRSR